MSNNTEFRPSRPPIDPRCYQITIIVRNVEGKQTNFRMKMSTQMGKMKKAYYRILPEVSPNSLIFLFKGREVKDYQTPKTLRMVDDDIVEVYNRREKDE